MIRPTLLGRGVSWKLLAQLSEGGAGVAYWQKRLAVNLETLGIGAEARFSILQVLDRDTIWNRVGTTASFVPAAFARLMLHFSGDRQSSF